MSLAQFHQWLVASEAGIELTASEAEVELAWAIQNRLYEWGRSGASEDALRAVLHEDAKELGFALPAPVLSTASASA
jgi:hypothetical protein